MSDTKPFPARVLLTVTTGRLLTKAKGPNDNGISDLYEILGWMTNDSPFTHQLGRFAEECKPWLLRWFPELAKADAHLSALDDLLSGAKPDREKIEIALSNWLGQLEAYCALKSIYNVPRIPRDDHEQKNPYDELVAMRGTDEGVIPIVADQTERTGT